MQIKIFYLENDIKKYVFYKNGEHVAEGDILKIEGLEDIFIANLFRDTFILSNIATGKRTYLYQIEDKLLNKLGTIYTAYIPIAYKPGSFDTSISKVDFLKSIINGFKLSDLF